MIPLDEQRSLELGELFRELRIARGLKLKDVASDTLSISQLSKFENGQTMLSADKLLVAIAKIHMSFSEFGHALNNYQEPFFFKLGKSVAKLHAKHDIEGLRELLDSVKEHETFDVYNQLNSLVVKVALRSLDNNYEILEKEKEFLTDYLYGIEGWTEYELYLFGNTMSILSDDDLIFLGKAFIDRDKLYLSLTSHHKNAELTCLNLILSLLERKKMYYAKYFMDELEKMLNYQDMFATTCLHFLKKVVVYLTDQSIELAELEHDIEMITALGNPMVANILSMNLKRLLQ